jgi:hypothetical protein
MRGNARNAQVSVTLVVSLRGNGSRSLHKGVHNFVAWIEGHPNFPGLALNPPATVTDLAYVEDRLASPLPGDLRMMLLRYNGATLPTGQLLSVGPSGVGTMFDALVDLAKRTGRSSADPEVLLPFFRSDDGGVRAFDRTAGPVSDTWTVVDYYYDSGELRLVHRTFDGFCRACVAEWTSPDFAEPFKLTKYLRAAERHVAIEPDVSIAHATLAHARRRNGQPEVALECYLRAARCVPAQLWCDWEALKLAALLKLPKVALEAAARLASRAPKARWKEREATPSMIADVIGLLSTQMGTRETLLRILDQLAEQVQGDAARAHIVDIRRALHSRVAPPPPQPVRPTAVPQNPDADAHWAAVKTGYEQGKVRDEDLLLDPAYAGLRDKFDLSSLLRVARDF